jgi:hypothetical protein
MGRATRTVPGRDVRGCGAARSAYGGVRRAGLPARAWLRDRVTASDPGRLRLTAGLRTGGSIALAPAVLAALDVDVTHLVAGAMAATVATFALREKERTGLAVTLALGVPVALASVSLAALMHSRVVAGDLFFVAAAGPAAAHRAHRPAGRHDGAASAGRRRPVRWPAARARRGDRRAAPWSGGAACARWTRRPVRRRPRYATGCSADATRCFALRPGHRPGAAASAASGRGRDGSGPAPGRPRGGPEGLNASP